jgi:hypothetical protein
MLFGPFVLMVSAGMLALRGKGFSSLDGVYFGTLGAMLLGRWIEFRSGQALTAEGEPATPGCLRRYFMGAITLVAVIWIAVHIAANFTATG